MMSTDPHFPFRPDVWWPDLFEPLSRAEREELINGLAISWHEGWVPNRADVEDHLAVGRGELTALQAALRSADRASAPVAVRAWAARPVRALPPGEAIVKCPGSVQGNSPGECCANFRVSVARRA